MLTSAQQHAADRFAKSLLGRLLAGLTETAGQILEEQHAQRMDIRSLHDQGRSLHDELHASKEELKSKILTSRAEATGSSKATNSALTSSRMPAVFPIRTRTDSPTSGRSEQPQPLP
jgi:hypothetical protein